MVKKELSTTVSARTCPMKMGDHTDRQQVTKRQATQRRRQWEKDGTTHALNPSAHGNIKKYTSTLDYIKREKYVVRIGDGLTEHHLVDVMHYSYRPTSPGDAKIYRADGTWSPDSMPHNIDRMQRDEGLRRSMLRDYASQGPCDSHAQDEMDRLSHQKRKRRCWRRTYKRSRKKNIRRAEITG